MHCRNTPSSRFTIAFAALAIALLSVGCGGRMIPGTDVPDTSENREIVEFVEQYRLGLEARSSSDLMQLVSRDYFDDNGTVRAEDDVDYGVLEGRLSRLTDDVLEVHYDMRYRRVEYRPDRIIVDVEYTGRFKLRSLDGEQWDRRLAYNRLELVREGGELRIISGM